ncbi:MAG: 16S rRNA (adenine(1518)-N(6)/adenine(1519)-N(6))-dimethyltransferase RsmA [Patescibacteria group bacterium]
MQQKKPFGQNFISDPGVIQALVQAANISKSDSVLEIGPGLGKVTEELLKTTDFLISVEIDWDLIPILNSKFSQVLNFQLVHKDALKFVQELITENGFFNGKKINKLVSSLPYQITSPLLHKLPFTLNFIEKTALIIQKEVAQRIMAKTAHSNYMATFLSAFFDINYIETIEKVFFDPIPEVDGALITLTPLKKRLLNTQQIQSFSKFLHHGFLQQRKMLNKRFDMELLEKVGIDPTRRAETLSLKEWLKLFNLYSH